MFVFLSQQHLNFFFFPLLLAWNCDLFQPFALWNIYIPYVWTLCGGILHATLPAFEDLIKVGFVCFLMPALHHCSPGITLSAPNFLTCVELDSTLSVAGKQWVILCAAVLHTCHFWDSVLTECFASCSLCLPPCSCTWFFILWTHFGFCSLPAVFFFDFLCSLIPRWGEIECVSQTCQSRGKLCFSHWKEGLNIAPLTYVSHVTQMHVCVPRVKN